MVDHAVVVKHIAEVALKIKEAVETVRRNKEDCIQIRRRVVNVSDILSQLQEMENIMSSNPAMSAALEDLANTLGRAHTLVIACQEKHIVCLFCTATTLSKKLRRVKDDISDQVMVGIFATTVHVTIALREIRGSNHEPEIQCRLSEELEASCMAPQEEPGTPLPRRRTEYTTTVSTNLWSPQHRSRRSQAAATQSPLEEKPESPPAIPDLNYSGASAAPEMATECDDDEPLSSLELLALPEPPPSPKPPPPPEERSEPSFELLALPPYQEEEPVLSPLSSQSEGFVGSALSPARESRDSEKSLLPFSGIQKFSFIELEIATRHFTTRIGQGGFATLYKGVLRDGLEVAIRKHGNARPSRCDEEPKMHPLIHLCSELDHKNIVKLLGYCHENRGFNMHNAYSAKEIVGSNEESLLLVEEYMTNGNLSNFIYGEKIDWSSRFRIIQGITQGIIYLHTESHKQPIVHLDLKPDNILLDSDMNPKIGDFGLAKILQDDKINASILGTLGYMPPEYIVEGVISVKNDIYGFGVTLLETISGMSKSGRDTRHQASIEWAWNVRNSVAVNKLFDRSLCDESQLKEIKRSMEIGLLCTQNKPTDRPTMPDVLAMLQGKKKVPTPKQPGYIKRVRAAGRYRKA